MSRELICSILNVPPDPWPPNHYALLGINQADFTASQLESRAAELSARLRTYQLGYPEIVTDALNRIAQALVCLQDPRARAIYDAKLAGDEPPATAPTRRPRDDLNPRRDTYRILAFGRRWLDAWLHLGRWLGESHGPLYDRREAVALMVALWSVRDLSRNEHAAIFLDETKPGAAVLQLARRRRVLNRWRKLTPGQREQLSHDWNAALAAIRRESARQRLRVTRRHGPNRILRRWSSFVAREGLDVAIVILAVMAVTIALIRGRF